MVANALETPTGVEVHVTWIFQYIIALFIFVQLIINGSLTFLLWLCAAAFSLTPILWASEPNSVELQRVTATPFFGYLTALLFGILTNRNIDIVNTEKIRTAAAIGSNIAHELRTPLASVRSLSHGLRNYLPSLIDGYNKAKEAELEVDEIRPRQMEQLESLLTRIESEVDYSNTIIDMLLINTADKPLTGVEYDRFFASSAIEESINRYPFNNQRERQLIRVEITEDFEIHAPRLLIVHVLFNLIKNGLYYVQRGGKGNITISTDVVDTGGRLVVHDTGAGISDEALKQIFEKFYTTTKTGQGAGIGLSFCEMVMKSVGGEISCTSVEDEYTTFTLTFPPPGHTTMS
jgi:two-component system CAI-1 autoinducer sensor kinase/phosphatase CqsS